MSEGIAAETMPFVIDGEFVRLEAHVVRGGCPHAPAGKKVEPWRETRTSTKGRLVGFRTDRPAGEMTHHGTRIHVHLLLEDSPLVAHVDDVVVKSGSVIRLPRMADAK